MRPQITVKFSNSLLVNFKCVSLLNRNRSFNALHAISEKRRVPSEITKKVNSENFISVDR